jgi:hypothetical protein
MTETAKLTSLFTEMDVVSQSQPVRIYRCEFWRWQWYTSSGWLRRRWKSWCGCLQTCEWNMVFAEKPIRIYRHSVWNRRRSTGHWLCAMDVLMFQSSEMERGTWIARRSFTGVSFGTNTDKPVPNAFIP